MNKSESVVRPSEHSLASASTDATECSQTEVKLHDGTSVRLRPIHPQDVELERQFIGALSPASRRYRFLETIHSPSAELLEKMTHIKPATDVAYVALLDADGHEHEIGVGRFSALPDGKDCEFAVTVADEWQNQGLGTLLMERLIGAARARGLETMFSSDASDNTKMRQFADHLHFHHKRDPDDARLVRYSVDIKPAGPITPP